jgi:hypothetical protein
MKKIISILLVLVVSSGFFTGCKKDKGAPPTLPPAESMTIDFSNFTTARKSLEFVSAEKGNVNSNWAFAAAAASVWKLIINSTLAIPVLAYQTAIGKTPAYVSTKNWEWSYTVTYLNDVYKARLTGLIRSSDVQWKMYISKDGTNSFTDFLWFEGTSKLDGTGGSWTLYQSPLVTDALLQIDWTKSATGIGNIKYSYVKNDASKGGFIEYGLTSNTLNAFYTIHYFNNVKFSDISVEWNTTTHEGHVKSADYLGDSNWYCWDSNKINTVCQ